MADIEIFIGAPIEHESDRAAFKRVVELLTEQNRRAVILANIEVGGRQIDLVLAMEGVAAVIEAKSSNNPLRGGVNGRWEVRAASGWKRIRNYYRQTMDAAHAMRDAMSAFAKADAGYPAAILLFTSPVPAGSSLCSSDHKVSIVGLDRLDGLLQNQRSGQWSLDQWKAFAEHLRLTRSSTAAAIDSRLADAEDLLERYGRSFRLTYGPSAAEQIPFPLRLNSEEVTSDAVVEKGACGASLLLRGPSGCGKTLMAFRIAVESLSTARLPIVVRARDFQGSLRGAIQEEAVLLDAPSAEALVNACRRLGRPITLVVDGYNECAADQRTRLVRIVAAACRRYEAAAVFTSQTALEPHGLLELDPAELSAPETETKKAIAARAAGTGRLHPALERLLESVNSGLEARLVGEIGRDASAGGSRYAIFYSYARRNLGDIAQDGIRALASIAGLLAERVRFSLSVRDLDRFADQAGIDSALLARLARSSLFAARGDRASFTHEMFLDAFAAEDLIRRAAGDAETIVRAMEAPIHDERKTLILGAIDDESVLAGVLAHVTDSATLEACLTGQCGQVARLWAERRREEIFRRMKGECQQIVFEIGDGQYLGVGISEASCVPWSAQDRAFLFVIGAMAGQGYCIDSVLTAAGEMDLRLDQEHRRLRAAAQEGKIALRSGLFANTYAAHRTAPGIGIVCSAVHQGHFGRPAAGSLAQQVVDAFSRGGLSAGQVYILLALSRQTLRADVSIAPLLPAILKTHWPGAAYHLRLDLLLAAEFCARASDDDRQAVIDALQELPPTQNIGLSSALVDALKSLGALENDEAEYVSNVRDEIRRVLAGPANADFFAAARALWFAQFDHPYEGAYYQAISELSDSDKKSLIVMAARGSDGGDSFFLSALIAEIAAFGDPSLGEVISRWLSTPEATSVFPQEAVKNFALTHIALARLGCDLPESADTTSADANALAALATILYWLNRSDMPLDQRRTACARPLEVLLRHERGASAGALWELQHSYLREETLKPLPGTEAPHTELGEFFPAEIAEIFREAIRRREGQTGYFAHTQREEILSFSIASLARWGTAADIPLLQGLSQDADLGRAAIAAIKILEQSYLES